MSSALSAMGMTLTWDGDLIAEVTSLAGPNSKVDTLDVTHYGSADYYREFIATFIDAGELAVEGNFISSDTLGQIAFIADFQARSKKVAILTFPSGAATTLTFDAIITTLTFSQPMDGKLGFSATLKISGVATLGLTLSTGMSACTIVQETGGAALTIAPAFAIGKFLYTTTEAGAAATWVKFTPTAASHTITITALGVDTTVASGAQSTAILIDATATVTPVNVKVVETGKVAKNYKFYIPRT